MSELLDHLIAQGKKNIKNGLERLKSKEDVTNGDIADVMAGWFEDFDNVLEAIIDEEEMGRRKSIQTLQIQAPWWDNNELVIIRSLKESDNEAIQDQLANMIASTGPNTPSNMQLRLGTSRRLTMLAGIVSWTFVNEQGNSMPLNETSLGDLASEDADFIYKAINDLNQPMTEPEKKDS